MDTPSKYAQPLAALEGVHVPLEEQVTGQQVAPPREYLAPEDLDRLRLLNSPAGSGRLRT